MSFQSDIFHTRIRGNSRKRREGKIHATLFADGLQNLFSSNAFVIPRLHDINTSRIFFLNNKKIYIHIRFVYLCCVLEISSVCIVPRARFLMHTKNNRKCSFLYNRTLYITQHSPYRFSILTYWQHIYSSSTNGQ